ncbi:MAG: hypothetical protein ACLVJ6_08000 [Merdibacter sp.]
MPFAGDAFSFAVQGSAFLALGVDMDCIFLQQLGQGCFDVGASGDELKPSSESLRCRHKAKLENGVSERFFIIPQGETQIRVKADQDTFSCGQIKQFASPSSGTMSDTLQKCTIPHSSRMSLMLSGPWPEAMRGKT